jgi:hypothetical protein
MDFSWALSALKAGLKVKRSHWKKGFLWLKPAARVQPDWCHDPVLKQLAEQQEGGIPASATISSCFKDSNDAWVVVTGWAPQQYDLFADDWIVYLGEGHEKQTPEEIEAYKELMLDAMPGSPAFRQRMLDMTVLQQLDKHERERKAEAMLDDAKRKEAFLKELDKAAIDKLPKAGSMENCDKLSNSINQLLDTVTCLPNLSAYVEPGPNAKELTITIREEGPAADSVPVHVGCTFHITHHNIVGCSVSNPDDITKSSIGGDGLNDKVEG